MTNCHRYVVIVEKNHFFPLPVVSLFKKNLVNFLFLKNFNKKKIVIIFFHSSMYITIHTNYFSCQMVAKDVLKFLDTNTKYGPLVLHGFSVGGYVWGEVLVNIASERERYAHVVDRIAAQIWDSAADITEISVGLPLAVFPRNTVMQAALRQYVL